MKFVKFLKKHFFYRAPLIAASESSRNVFAQQIFSLKLKLCLYVIYFYYYYFFFLLLALQKCP